jgi:hypothetical protein
VISVEERHRLAHLQYARAGAVPDVVPQRLGAAHVGRDQHRAPILVAAVDHRVELLQAPLVLLRHGEVLQDEKIDTPEQLQQPQVGVLRAVLVGRADAREQLRPGEDRQRAALAQDLLRHAHREARLAAPDLPEEVEPTAARQVVVEAAAVLAHLAHDPLVEVRDRPALEVDVEVAPRDRGGEPGRPGGRNALAPAAALAGPVRLLDLDPAAPVAVAVAARLRAHAALPEVWRAAWSRLLGGIVGVEGLGPHRSTQ